MSKKITFCVDNIEPVKKCLVGSIAITSEGDDSDA